MLNMEERGKVVVCHSCCIAVEYADLTHMSDEDEARHYEGLEALMVERDGTWLCSPKELDAYDCGTACEVCGQRDFIMHEMDLFKLGK